MAIRRDVTATWKPSLSPDVKAQKVYWYVNGKLIKRVILRARENTRYWSDDNSNHPIREGDTIECRVCAVDEVGESNWIEGQVKYPYYPPNAPTDLNLKQLPLYLDIP